MKISGGTELEARVELVDTGELKIEVVAEAAAELLAEVKASLVVYCLNSSVS